MYDLQVHPFHFITTAAPNISPVEICANMEYHHTLRYVPLPAPGKPAIKKKIHDRSLHFVFK